MTLVQIVMATVNIPLSLEFSLSMIENTNINEVDNNSADDFNFLPEERASVFVWVYISPVLILLGTFGNVSTIAVLRRIKWGNSTQHLYLIGLAVADLILLLVSLLRRWVLYTFSVDVRDLHWVVCKLHIWVTYTAGFMSAWFLVTVTAQRTMAVVWPYRISLLCTPRRAKIGVAVVSLLSCAFNAHLLYGYDVNQGCRTVPEYKYVALVIHPWIDMTLSSLLPFVLIILCNSALIWKIRTSVKDMRTLSANSASTREIANRKRVVSSMTVAMITVSFTFLVLTLPVCVFLLWSDSIVQSGQVHADTFYAKLDLVFAVTNMLWYANSAINFLIYCVSGKKFRKGFVRLLRCARAADSLPILAHVTTELQENGLFTIDYRALTDK